MPYRVTLHDVKMMEAIVQDIGNHELALEVAMLQGRLCREFNIAHAVRPDSFTVMGKIGDTEGYESWRVEGACCLERLEDHEIETILDAEGDDENNELYTYYGRESDTQVPAWGCLCERELDATLNDDVGAKSSYDLEQLEAWCALSRPEFWAAYKAKRALREGG